MLHVVDDEPCVWRYLELPTFAFDKSNEPDITTLPVTDKLPFIFWFPTNELLPVVANPSPIICDEPETIPEGLLAMLSQVVCVMLPLRTYLVSYELVNWELPETMSEGIPVNPEYTTCDEPDTKPEGLFAMLSQVVWVILPLRT